MSCLSNVFNYICYGQLCKTITAHSSRNDSVTKHAFAQWVANAMYCVLQAFESAISCFPNVFHKMCDGQLCKIVTALSSRNDSATEPAFAQWGTLDMCERVGNL